MSDYINLASGALVYEGQDSIPLTQDQLLSLVSEDDFNQDIAVAQGNSLVFVVDLEARYNLSSVSYQYTASNDSNVEIYGRQTVSSLWEPIPSTPEPGFIVANISGLENKYQQFKIMQTSFVGTGYAGKFRVVPQSNFISVGSPEEGEVRLYTVASAVTSPAVTPVHVRNVGGKQRKVTCLVDPSYPNYSNVELSSDGLSFFGIYSKGVKLPSDYSWSAGVFSGTEESSGTVTLVSASGTGSYYSPILDVSSFEGARIFWRAVVSGSNTIGSLEDVYQTPVVSFRASPHPPEEPWEEGEISNDSRWSVVSGTLPFKPVSNNTILKKDYKGFIQFRVDLSGTDEVPSLVELGVENPLSIDVDGSSYGSFKVRSADASTLHSGNAGLLVWYNESDS